MDSWNDLIWIVLEVIGALILIFGVYGFMVYLKLTQFREQVEGDLHSLIPKFNPRYKLLTDLLACISENNIEEKAAVSAAVNLRSRASKAKTPREHLILENEFTVSLLRLLVILKKRYPELKNDLWYLDIVEKFSIFTDNIDKAGMSYNVITRSYNELITSWPSKYIAKRLKHKTVPVYLSWEEAKYKLSGKEPPSKKEIAKKEREVWSQERKKGYDKEKADRIERREKTKSEKAKQKERDKEVKEKMKKREDDIRKIEEERAAQKAAKKLERQEKRINEKNEKKHKS